MQYVNLSNNFLYDLSPLGQLPFLMYLDVSHNELEEVLRFDPPYNLTYVNFSYNQVERIDDLSDFWSLVYLDLSNNQITEIEGLSGLKFLRHLNLSNNQITHLANLDDMNLITLNLEHNEVSTFERDPSKGFASLKKIVSVQLGHNALKTLELFRYAHNIQSIQIQKNLIEDLSELRFLKALIYLTTLDLLGNEITKKPNYTEMCFIFVQHLGFLDGEYVDAEEKAAAIVKYHNNVNFESGKRDTLLLFANQLSLPSISSAITPADQPCPPILVVVGPQSSNKKFLVKKFVEENSKLVKK